MSGLSRRKFIATSTAAAAGVSVKGCQNQPSVDNTPEKPQRLESEEIKPTHYFEYTDRLGNEGRIFNGAYEEGCNAGRSILEKDGATDIGECQPI